MAEPLPVRKKQADPATAAPKQKKKEPTPLDRLKLQIAEELGLAEKVRVQGWGMLTAAESGRLGGILNRRLREQGLVIGPKGQLLPQAQGQ